MSGAMSALSKAAIAATSVWPEASIHALNEWPPAIDPQSALALCGACPSTSLGYNDARWKAGGGAYVNVFGIEKYNCKCVPAAAACARRAPLRNGTRHTCRAIAALPGAARMQRLAVRTGESPLEVRARHYAAPCLPQARTARNLWCARVTLR